jgi:hypothetical protein
VTHRNDMTANKMQQPSSGLMPITCGSYNNYPQPSSMQNIHSYSGMQGIAPGGLQNVLQGGMQSGVQGGLQSIVQSGPSATTPTGYPTGGTATPLYPTVGGTPNVVQVPGENPASQMPITVSSTLYTPGFLRTAIGKRVRVEFLIGTNTLTDRTGTLIAVGASYILLRLIESDDILLCDIYSIKFVTILL